MRTLLTDAQMDLLLVARVLASDGCGMVLEDEAIPDAHALAEAGWLRRAFVEDELAWFWTPEAEQALHFGAMVIDAHERAN